MVKFDVVAFVFFLGVPFKCKEEMILNSERAQLCQSGAALEPEYVNILEGS